MGKTLKKYLLFDLDTTALKKSSDQRDIQLPIP